MTHQRLLQWVSMTTTVLASLWFYTATLDPFNITKLAILVVGAAALIGLLAGSFKAWWKKDEWPLLAVVGLFLFGLTVAALATDQHIYRTLWGAWARNDGWLAYAALAVILFAVAIAYRGAQARFGAYAIAGVGVIEVTYSMIQTFGADPISWNSSYNAILGTVGNPNFASALLGITGVVLAWMALDAAQPRYLRIASALVSLIAFWLTIRSDSIQGTLAYAAGLALLIAAWMSMPERRVDIRKLAVPYIGLIVLGGLVGVLGLAGSGPLARLLDTQNLLNRKYYWKTAWNMFRDHPVVGVGLDSLGDFYRVYRAEDTVGMPGLEVSTNAAHSILFQALATGGLAFAGTYVLIQVFVAWRTIVAVRSAENRLLVGGLGGAWFAFQLQSMFSIDQLGLTVWGWVLGGLLIGLSYPGSVAVGGKSKRRNGARGDATNGVPIVLASLLALGAIVLVSVPLAADKSARLIISYSADRTNTAQVTATADAVMIEAEKLNDPYMRAQAVSKLYEIGAVDAGIGLAEESARTFPNDVTLWNLVAAAYEQTGRPALAVPARTEALRLDPLNTEYMTLLAQDKAAT